MMTFSAKMALCIAAFQCKKVFAAGSEGSQPNTFLMDKLKKVLDGHAQKVKAEVAKTAGPNTLSTMKQLTAFNKAFINPRQAIREYKREHEKAQFQTLQAGLGNLTATTGDKLLADAHWKRILQDVNAGIFILETNLQSWKPILFWKPILNLETSVGVSYSIQ